MSWIRSAMNKAAEVPGGAILKAAVRTYADSFVQHAGYSVSGAARIFQDRIASRNMKSFSEAARRLEEASVSCKGEDRVQLLRRWLVSLREFEKLDGSLVEIDGKSSEDPSSPSDKNVTPGKSTMILYYDPDLGSSPMNFRDVFLQSQALEGMTVSMLDNSMMVLEKASCGAFILTAGSLFCLNQILGAPNEEEILLIHEIFGLCLAGGREVHDVVVKNIQDLAKAFSLYDVEMLVRREELLQFAQTAITGLKETGDIARIDFEISQIHQRLNSMKCQQSAHEGTENSSEATSTGSLMEIEEPVTHIQLCCRLKSLLLKKRLLRYGDTIETHAQKVDILKVLVESLHNSASKTEKRILEQREEKNEALTFRVARSNEVSQIEKELGAEISELEKQRDKIEAELREVNSTLSVAYARLQHAREERFQFDEDNNDFILLLKEKEDELSNTIVSYRAEADTCHAFVNFLEATWAFQSSYVEERDKLVNDQLQDHEVYFVNTTISFLSAYKDQLPPAIANVRKLEESLKGFRKIIDPDEEFLQDIKKRENVEQEYLDAEVKVINIFDAVESIKDHFYTTIDDPSRKGVEVITELLEAIEKLKIDFKIIKRPNLSIEKVTEGEHTPSTGGPEGVMVPPPIRVMPDFKSIFAQKLLIKSPRQKPYIPLGASPENSPFSTNERKTFEYQTEKDASNPALVFDDETLHQKSTVKSDQERLTLDSSDEIPKIPLTDQESGETSQFSLGDDLESLDSNEEMPKPTSRIEKEMSTN
ncbi:uncharacterized protein LOC111887542 [Lactuca sativa]|uniref:uncharacterized protein LOC111887542 n=1 Tax=Lactuca sativa TaxID=4236 RepID=UPI001C6942C7|nr:uncharacterized protein LOC111887542 [Lactuca sativa]